MNTFGQIFRFTSFGESHGPAVGGVVDGCPAGLLLDTEAIRRQLARRASGGSARAAAEPDDVVWLSGLNDGVTTGAPIAFYIANRAQRPEDYDNLRDVFRPGHADYTYYVKYGLLPQSGGGRASARETAARVVAGCIAAQLLAEKGVKIEGEVEERTAPTPGEELQDGDSIGGTVRCRISGLPAGVGEPIFDKLQARLAYAMLSINACKGFEYGAGFAAATMRGSEYNRRSDGIAGGISDGHEIEFRVVFKPASSIALPQQAQTVDGRTVEITIQGRHDRCIAVRAVPVVEAMTALVLADLTARRAAERG